MSAVYKYLVGILFLAILVLILIRITSLETFRRPWRPNLWSIIINYGIQPHRRRRRPNQLPIIFIFRRWSRWTH